MSTLGKRLKVAVDIVQLCDQAFAVRQLPADGPSDFIELQPADCSDFCFPSRAVPFAEKGREVT